MVSDGNDAALLCALCNFVVIVVDVVGIVTFIAFVPVDIVVDIVTVHYY